MSVSHLMAARRRLLSAAGASPVVAMGAATVDATSFSLNPLALGGLTGDIMIVASMWESDSAPSLPGGWTTLFNADAPCNASARYLVQHITFAGTPPSSVAWSYAGSSGIAYSHIILRGGAVGALTNPIDANSTPGIFAPFAVTAGASGVVAFALADAGPTDDGSASTVLTNMDQTAIAAGPVLGRHAMIGWSATSETTAFNSSVIARFYWQAGWIPLG